MTQTFNRTSNLIVRKLRSMALPYIASAIGKTILICIDFFVAGHFISINAMSAIALAAPFLGIDEMLHCLLGMGISDSISKAVAVGDKRKANRIIGAIIIAVLVLYILVFLPILIFLKDILLLISEDAELIRGCMDYMYPTLIVMPFFEVLMCLEKSFLIDGRPVLFSSRPIITGACKIILNILLVVVFNKGVYGIAIATIIATLLGYCVTMSHMFSGKCTVHPDFSVIRKWQEFMGYIKTNVVKGGTAAIDSFADVCIDALICKLLLSAGSVGATAIWSMFFQFISALGIGISGITSAVVPLGGTFFAERDYFGVKAVMKSGRTLSLIFGTMIAVVVLIFIPEIAVFYGMQGETATQCSMILREVCAAFLAFTIAEYYEYYFLMVEKYKLAYSMEIMKKALAAILALIGYFFGTRGIIICYAASYILICGWIFFVLRKDGNSLLPKKVEEISFDYSISLSSETISAISSDIYEKMKELDDFAQKAGTASLLIEEGLCLISKYNPEHCVEADIRVRKTEDVGVISFKDNGKTYNLLDSAKDTDKISNLEENLIKGMTLKVKYERIMELNCLTLVFKL